MRLPFALRFVSVYLKRERRLLSLGFLALLLSLSVYMQIPLYLKQAVDLVAHRAPVTDILGVAGIITVLTIVQGLGRFYMRVWIVTASRRVEHRLRMDLWAHLLQRPTRFYDQIYTGDIMARLTNDLNAVRMALGPALMYAAYAGVSMAWALGYMLSIHAGLALAVIGPMSLIIVLMFYATRAIRSRFQRVQEGFASMSRAAQETFTGIRDVKAFAVEPIRARDFRNRVAAYVQSQKELSQIHSLLRPIMGFLTGLGLLTLLGYGGALVARGRLTLGTFVAFKTYLAMLIWPLVSVGWIANLWQRGRASLTRILELIDFSTFQSFVSENALKDLTNRLNRVDPATFSTRYRGPLVGELAVHDLAFAYEDGTPVLRGITLDLSAGTWCAVVGPPGSSKTTLLKLITGLYPPTHGEIRWDGRTLLAWDWSALRRQCVYVPQEAVLFSRSIRENLVMGLDPPYPEDDELRAVLERVAFLEDLERLPHGLDTRIGERGVNLSGGQRQRLALARALLRRPRVLLLDDPFSQVDVHTERRIWENLKRAYRGRCTLILVTQRLLVTRDCDQVVVLEQGRITQRGTPAQLMVTPGWFATAIELQERLLKQMPSMTG